MDTAVHPSATSIIGARLRKARKAHSLTQEQLAAPFFTKGYVSAVERGAVRPSLKALEHLAARLGLPLSYFVSGVETGTGPGMESGLLSQRNVEAIQEDLNYQYNYARMMIRNKDPGIIEEALKVIEVAEQCAAPYIGRLPARLLYRPHFLRALAYMKSARRDSSSSSTCSDTPSDGISLQIGRAHV